MRLTFAGSGAAFTLGDGNFQSNMVLEAPDVTGRLLLDCGTDARHSLAGLGLSYADIDAVFISHLHADHIGGLEWLALSTYFDPSCKRPRLVAPAPLADSLWHNALSAGLGLIDSGPASLSTYFDVETPAESGQFDWAGTRFSLVPVPHVTSPSGQGQKEMKSHGVLFSSGGRQIYITTDMQFDARPGARPYDQADVIFHDCETGARSGVHCHFSELTTLPDAIKAKCWLYHFQQGPRPDAKAHGFLGFVERGQSFDWR